MEKLYHFDLNASSLYEIDEFAKKFNINKDRFEDWVLNFLNSEIPNIIKRADESAYENGYNECKRDLSNTVHEDYILESEHYSIVNELEEEILTLKRENDQITLDTYDSGFRDGYRMGYISGIKWEEPAKGFPELVNIYKDL
jgi:hypothetical protein